MCSVGELRPIHRAPITHEKYCAGDPAIPGRVIAERESITQAASFRSSRVLSGYKRGQSAIWLFRRWSASGSDGPQHWHDPGIPLGVRPAETIGWPLAQTHHE